MGGLTKLLEGKLKLKVNREKSAVARPWERKFLGFSFTNGKLPKRRIAPKAKARFEARIRILTRRTRGISIETMVRELVMELRNEWELLEEQINQVSQELAASAKKEDTSRRLLTVPGIGPLTATALSAAIGNGIPFRTGRDLAAWLGLVPRQHSTGGKARLLGISKRGNPYLRRLFVHGARSVLARVKRSDHSFGEWLNRLEARSPRNVAIVALANKLARIAWAVLTSGQVYLTTATATMAL